MKKIVWLENVAVISYKMVTLYLRDIDFQKKIALNYAMFVISSWKKLNFILAIGLQN